MTRMQKAPQEHDWCHVCGLREYRDLYEIIYPENAEHGDGNERFVRICHGCVAALSALFMLPEGKSLDRAFLRRLNKAEVKLSPDGPSVKISDV